MAPRKVDPDTNVDMDMILQVYKGHLDVIDGFLVRARDLESDLRHDLRKATERVALLEKEKELVMKDIQREFPNQGF